MSYKMLSRKKALMLLRKKNPENIVKHSIKVAEIALKIAKKLKAKGYAIDLKLIEISALLHDLDKFESLSKGYDYAENTKELYRKGYRKIAKTIMNSQLDNFLNKNLFKHSLEEIVIQYADKRVKHSKIVSLKERFKYLHKRYGVSKKIIKKLKKAEKTLQKIEKYIKKLSEN